VESVSRTLKAEVATALPFVVFTRPLVSDQSDFVRYRVVMMSSALAEPISVASLALGFFSKPFIGRVLPALVTARASAGAAANFAR